MQNLVNGVYSKRFLVIYLSLVAILLLFFLPGKSENDPYQQQMPTESGPLTPPLSLPQFLLQKSDASVFTNADLLGKWHVVYLYDGTCEPVCMAIWQVLNNLGSANASEVLSIVLVDLSNAEQNDLSVALDAPSVQILAATNHESIAPLKSFLTEHIEAPQTYLFLMDPQARWYAQFKAPFTSSGLQRQYLNYRAAYARSE